MRYFSKTSLIFLLSIFSLSCGGDNQDQVGFVTDTRVDPQSVNLNQLATVRVDFEPSQNEDLSDPDASANLKDTDVVIKLPIGVDYVTDSSDFDGSDVSGFKKRNPNRVEICSDGTRALTYQFSSGELTDNENSIRISVTPFQAQGNVIFYAMADSFIFDSCDISSEDSDTLNVLP